MIAVVSGQTLQWSDIHCYLIKKPSVYTREKVHTYKSMDAYQFAVCGHVQEVKYHNIDGEFCVLSADVLPGEAFDSVPRLECVFPLCFTMERQSAIVAENAKR